MQDLSHPALEAVVVNGSTAPIEEGAPAMFCTQCGTRNGGDAKFCKQCGHKLDRTAPLRFSEEEFLLPESREEKVRDLLLAAYQKYETDDLDGAISICDEALDIRPDSTDAHSLISTLYEKKGDRDRAIESREKVLALNPGSIADREKLDELRDGRTVTAPTKITSSRRATRSPFVESAAVQSLVALCVMLIVLGVGASLLWIGRANPRVEAQKPAGQNQQGAQLQVNPGVVQPGAVSGGLQPGALSGVQQAGAAAGAGVNPGAAQAAGQGAQQSNVISNYADAFNSQRTPRPDRFGSSPLTAREIVPAPVNPQIDSSSGRLSGQGALPDRGAIPNQGGSTFRLTDQELDGQGITVDGTANPPARSTPPPVGKFEIIVSSDPKPASGSGSKPAAASSQSDPGSLDSRTALEVARDLHNKSQHARAITFYKKALDGAGDSAGDIHQRIGLCYQRLNDKPNAVHHYQQGIEAYKSQMSAGKNVEAARNGIRACENGVKVCQ